MDLQLHGKRALVSAASVAICCRRFDDLDEALGELSSLGTAVGQVWDMADPDAVAAQVSWSVDARGGIDICVGNASASCQCGEGQPWRRSFDVDILGTGAEVADGITFLASPRASWGTGANVVVDGGYMRQVGF